MSSQFLNLLGDDYSESNSKHALYEACTNGSIEDIATCFENGDDPSDFIKDGKTSLHVVVESRRDDSEQILDFLLQTGVDVNVVSEYERDTALHLVVKNLEITEAYPLALKLLEYGADLHIRNKSLRTPYDYAMAREFYDLVGALDGTMAVEEAREDLVKKRGHVYGVKLVTAVIESDDLDIRECIRSGADCNYLNEHGAGAIHYVITHCTLPTLGVLDLLVSAGADVNLRDYEGDTVLNLAIKSESLRQNGQMPTVVSKLIEWGALSTYRDLDDHDAVSLATKRDYADILRILRNRRASHVRSEEDDGDDEQSIAEQARRVSRRRQTHLIRAVQDEDTWDVRQLVNDRDANPNLPDETGLYPIHLAVIRGNMEERYQVIEELLEAGADVDSTDTETGDTALHMAVDRNLIDTVRQLVDHHANVDIRNMDGQTAYDIAVENHFTDIMSVLGAPREQDQGGGRGTKNKAKNASSCAVM